MNKEIESYLTWIRTVRRYSTRTVDIYRGSLELFSEFVTGGEVGSSAGGEIPDSLTAPVIRSYEVWLMEEKKMSARTVGLHISVLSGFCKYLMKDGTIGSNPVRSVKRPKTEKRLPQFYRKEAMEAYFAETEVFASEDLIKAESEAGVKDRNLYERRLRRLIISILYSTGIRRSELIGLRTGDIDFSRKTAKIRGKGDKMREIPLVASLCKEISLYLHAVEAMFGERRGPDSPLLLTPTGRPLYPVYADKAVKTELGQVKGITGQKSPHVLRHTLATELLDEETDLNSIKELLGHSSLAATQVYTHNSIAKLKKVYESAHPRASKNGGKNGD
ncbi:MAG: tyrosine-type recombinase/integrase [Candidatus Cryptobacteroides sp.]